MMRDGNSMPPLNAVVHGIGTARSAPMRKYIKRKCKDCGQEFEVRIDHKDDLYGEYCPTCFLNNVIEDIYGGLRRKTDKEKERDLSYKDKLQGVTHRGKHRVDN